MIEIYSMTEEEKVKCHSIIHTASLTAGAIGGGLAQLPTSDNLAIVPIQLTMIIGLGAVFQIDLDKSTAKATLATATATLTGRTISQVLVGWMPGIGNVLNAVTAASITEAIGWNVANDFHKKSRQERIINRGIPIESKDDENDEEQDELDTGYDFECISDELEDEDLESENREENPQNKNDRNPKNMEIEKTKEEIQ